MGRNGKAVVYAETLSDGQRVIRVSRVMEDGQLDVYTTFYMGEADGDRLIRVCGSLTRIVLAMAETGWEIEVKI